MAANPLENDLPQLGLEIPCGFVAVDKREAFLLEDSTDVLELVFNGPSSASGQERLQFSIDLSLDWSLPTDLSVEQVEIRSDESLDFPSPPRVSRPRLVRVQI
jgi:hypothetical protein